MSRRNIILVYAIGILASWLFIWPIGPTLLFSLVHFNGSLKTE